MAIVIELSQSQFISLMANTGTTFTYHGLCKLYDYLDSTCDDYKVIDPTMIRTEYNEQSVIQFVTDYGIQDPPIRSICVPGIEKYLNDAGMWFEWLYDEAGLLDRIIYQLF